MKNVFIVEKNYGRATRIKYHKLLRFVYVAKPQSDMSFEYVRADLHNFSVENPRSYGRAFKVR